MKAAVVHEAGKPPVFDGFETPDPGEGEYRVRVLASGISPLARLRAAGTHYSADQQFPRVAGVDGTGVLDDGSKVYFVLPRPPFGAMAEQTVVAKSRCLLLPEGLDEITAAAIANPGVSSWAGLTERAMLKAGETVLVNGATGASGRLAVAIARHMGAGRIIATGRNRSVLESLDVDAIMPLSEDGAQIDSAFAREIRGGVDVVLDYLWGDSAERIIRAVAADGASGSAVRFVQIGTASGPDIRLPGASLRSTGLQLIGSGIGSVSLDRLMAATAALLGAAVEASLKLPINIMPLEQVTQAWGELASEARTVISIS